METVHKHKYIFSHLLLLTFTVSMLNFRLVSGWKNVPCSVLVFLKAIWLPSRSCRKTHTSRRLLASNCSWSQMCSSRRSPLSSSCMTWLADINRQMQSRMGRPVSPKICYPLHTVCKLQRLLQKLRSENENLKPCQDMGYRRQWMKGCESLSGHLAPSSSLT